MEFTLYYEGKLKANGGSKEKHHIRNVLHNQLKELWDQVPLKNDEEFKKAQTREINGIVYIPLVTESAGLTAELDITMLRPGKPGSIIMQGGDIDNKLKTFLDALRVPSENEIPKSNEAEAENPFYCLFEDDILIEKIQVKTDKLLLPSEDSTYVKMFVHVRTKKYKNLLLTSELP